MKFYLAGQYRNKEVLRRWAAGLRYFGHEVTAHWLEEKYDPAMTLAELTDEDCRHIAEQDLDDIRRCDAIVFQSEAQSVATVRGGRHVEFGYALAFDKKLIVVGPRENIFHYLTDVEAFPDYDTFIAAIPDAREVAAK